MPSTPSLARSVSENPVVAPLVTGRFAEGANYATWRPRGTADYLLILTIGGSGRFGHAHGDLRAAPGDVTILRPGARHDYATAPGAPGWSLLWAHFLPRPAWIEWLSALPEAAPGIAHLSLGADTTGRAAVESALDAMNRYALGGLPRRADFAMNALECALLHLDAANPSASALVRFDERVLRVMERLRGDGSREPLSLTGLACAVCLSPSRLSHLFKQETGRTPAQFHEDERMLRARQLLALTNRAVGAIAEEVGFASPFYFSLRFKARVGQSPRDFRRVAQGGEVAKEETGTEAAE